MATAPPTPTDRATLIERHKQATKAKLPFVDIVTAAPGCTWSTDQLLAMPLGELQKMASLVPAAARDDEDDHFAPLAPSPWDSPTRVAAAGGNPDYAECLKSPWARTPR